MSRFQFLLVAIISLCISAIYLYLKQSDIDPMKIASVEHLFTSYTYRGPTQPIPGQPQLVRVEILVRDSSNAAGVQIKSVTFNGQAVPLKPRDIHGNRGTSSFQLPSGKYQLKWVVQREKLIWPRLLTHEEEVTIDPRDLWIQIEIIGNDATIR